jgi:hypothetical protein
VEQGISSHPNMSIDHRVDALPFRLLPRHVRILPAALTKLEAAFLRDNRRFFVRGRT